MSDIKVKTKKRTIKPITVKQLIDDYFYLIDLDADYQRETIWSRKKQEELLDSIIQGIDIPKFYIAEVKDDETFEYECIDGKQRMTTLLNFYKPDPNGDNSLKIKVAGEKYTYNQLRKEIPQLADKIDEFELTFVIYPEIDDEEFIRDIFRRLQLGVPLNAGELLKTYTGTMRDFVYKEMGSNAPFLRNTKLSEKRFSRQFTLAQVCINSFARNEGGDFKRARYDDLWEFFKEKYDLNKNDKNLVRIRKVLGIMDKKFKGKDAEKISSRAVAVSGYLFIEDLVNNKKTGLIIQFIKFYVKLLDEIKKNQELLSDFKPPENSVILEEFQKYISQASVEPYSLRRRNEFLKKAFQHYANVKTKGKIIGSK